MYRHYSLLFLFLCVFIQAHPLKILMLVSTFPYATRAYITNQISGLLDAGHEVFILAKYQVQSQNCPIFEKYNLKERTFYNDLPASLRNFDIVYAQFGSNGIQGMKLIKQGYISGKLIVSFRGKDGANKLYNDPYVYNELFDFASLCLPVCNKFRDVLISYGCKPEKVKVLYSGIDCNQFSYLDRDRDERSDKIQMVTVARLSRLKGIEYAIQAVHKIKKIYPHIVFYIIGQGSHYKKLERLIKNLNLQREVFLVGYKSQDEIVTYLHNSDIFIYSAISTDTMKQDGIANVLKEAMATGLVPVTTDQGGNNEIIKDDENGFLVSEKDIDALAKKILYLIEHPKKRLKMGKCASTYIRKIFCKERLNLELIKMMEEITS